jgi:hypothetical protein
MKVHLRIKLTWQLNNSIQLFISSCELEPPMHFHSLRRREPITEQNQVVLYTYSPPSAQTMKVHLRIKLTWQLNNCIQLFISSCEFDPQMHFHSLCRRGVITEENVEILLSYSTSSTQRMKVHLRIKHTWQLNNCIEWFRCHVSLILTCIFILCVEGAE